MLVLVVAVWSLSEDPQRDDERDDGGGEEDGCKGEQGHADDLTMA